MQKFRRKTFSKCISKESRKVKRRAAQAAFETHGFAMHEETSAEPEAVILGAVVDCRKGMLSATPRRRIRLHLALL